jgi:signal transduction histidine kinase
LAHLDRALALVDTGIRSIRAVTQRLRPSLLDDLGLLPALRALVAEFHKADGLSVSLSAPSSIPDLTDETEVAMFRVVQEGLSNVVRHASARSATVRVEVTAVQCVVQVRDDGLGPQTAAGEHMGLAGMRERVLALGGAVTFGAAPEGGALLEVVIPR